ncbi:MAG TPA: mannitol dehydrogenase family protein [Roseiarcus sp.]|nr:mannitol dehydrogenase family protein [Roseiarcus sp.]
MVPPRSDVSAPRLSDATLGRLPNAISRPGYDRNALQAGIVHLGLGAFHRAHQAAYTEAVLNAGDRRWATIGVSLRSPETREALAPQDNLYTLALRDGAGERLQIIGGLAACLVAPEDPRKLVEAMARPETRIVSLTVTEKGYCHNPATGELDESHPHIRHDLAERSRPRTAIGFIVEALALRRERRLAPFTLLSCDNLPTNGETLKRVLTGYAALRDRELARFVADAVACPSTMVDRIVPATTDADRDSIAAASGLRDAWPVVAEPFAQWVIEDRFPSGRPEWDRAGAMFVKEVAAFEMMKLRLLNGAHSTLAYLGYLAGCETIAETMAAPGFARLAEDFMAVEAAPTLPPLPGLDLAAYRRDLIARFCNPALRHRTWQIAMDGSQKLPQRLLNTIRARLGANAPFPRLALGVAAWMRYATGVDEKGGAIDVRDPLAARIKEMTRGVSEASALVSAYFRLAEVFGADLPADARFRSAVTTALAALLTKGSARVVAGFEASAA